MAHAVAPSAALPPARLAPTSAFQPWLEFLANINPVTYILEGMRSLILRGWEWDERAAAFASAGGVAAVTIALSLLPSAAHQLTRSRAVSATLLAVVLQEAPRGIP